MALKRNREEEERIIGDKPVTPAARAFKCKKCDRQFDTCQALGGHTAGHNNKPGEPPKNQRDHRCSICGDVFPSGQALGGHMTKHRSTVGPTISNEPASSDLTVGADHAMETREGNTRRSLDFDLNLVPDNEYNYNKSKNNKLKLRLGDYYSPLEKENKSKAVDLQFHYEDLSRVRLQERGVKLKYYEFL